MPATTNINTAMELYSNSFIEELQARIPALRSFSLDLSDELVEPGDVIRVPLVFADAAADWDKTSNNYGRTKADLLDRTVPIDQRVIAGFAIEQQQLANFRPHWWEGKGKLNARSVATAVLKRVFAKVTPENFGDAPADKFSVNPASFNPKVVAALRAAVAAKEMDPSATTMLLHPVYFSALLGTLDANVYGGREAIAKGVIPGLLGFDSIQEATQLEIPGFVGAPSALAVGSRRVPIADTTPYMEYSAITEEQSGLTLNRVIYTDGKTGVTSFSIECMFGVEKGNDNALIRLVSGSKPPPSGKKPAPTAQD